MIFWLQLKSPILKQITNSPVMGYVIYRSFLGRGGSMYPIEITLLHYLRSKTFMIFWQKVIAWFVLWQLFWMQRVQRNMQQGKQNLETPLPKGKSWNVKLFYKILKMVHLLNFLGEENTPWLMRCGGVTRKIPQKTSLEFLKIILTRFWIFQNWFDFWWK